MSDPRPVDGDEALRLATLVLVTDGTLLAFVTLLVLVLLTQAR